MERREVDIVRILSPPYISCLIQVFSCAKKSDKVSFEVFAKVSKLNEEKLDVEIETLFVANIVDGRKPGK
jgi:RIO-like serine/threonine protein kinase